MRVSNLCAAAQMMDGRALDLEGAGTPSLLLWKGRGPDEALHHVPSIRSEVYSKIKTLGFTFMACRATPCWKAAVHIGTPYPGDMASWSGYVCCRWLSTIVAARTLLATGWWANIYSKGEDAVACVSMDRYYGKPWLFTTRLFCCS